MIRIEAQQIEIQFADRQILKPTSFKINAGDIILLEGEIGSGKSSLLKLLAGQAGASKGNLNRYFGWSELAYVPQFRSNPFHLPLNLQEFIQVSTNRTLQDFRVLNKSQSHLGWNEASGGERTLCLLEAALLKEPKLLLLDEILTWLDQESSRKVCRLLEQMPQMKDAPAVVCVEHEPNSIPFTRRWRIKEGQMFELA